MQRVHSNYAGWAASLALLFVSFSAGAFENQNFIGGGVVYGGDSDTDTFDVHVTYEYQLSDFLGLEGRPLLVKYDYEDGNVNKDEDGKGVGAAIFANFYPISGSGLQLGIGTGVAAFDWDYGCVVQSQNTVCNEDKIAIGGLGKLGYKFELGNLFITPEAQVGQWFGAGEELGWLFTAGLNIGYAF